MLIYDQAGVSKTNEKNIKYKKLKLLFVRVKRFTTNQTLQERNMKIIDMIKQRLGLDEQDLDKEMNLEELNKIQHQIDEVRDELITEQAQLEAEAKSKESQEWADNLSKARAGKHKQNLTRKKLRHMKGINPARLRMLKEQGKL